MTLAARDKSIPKNLKCGDGGDAIRVEPYEDDRRAGAGGDTTIRTDEDFRLPIETARCGNGGNASVAGAIGGAGGSLIILDREAAEAMGAAAGRALGEALIRAYPDGLVRP